MTLVLDLDGINTVRGLRVIVIEAMFFLHEHAKPRTFTRGVGLQQPSKEFSGTCVYCAQ
ncbi:hypothetical protein KUV98_03395 [Mameliella alba]|nr:hypothetical protein [Mameliella alba]MBY6168367.1 hypothetical protein [Mameliella alba]